MCVCMYVCTEDRADSPAPEEEEGKTNKRRRLRLVYGMYVCLYVWRSMFSIVASE